MRFWSQKSKQLVFPILSSPLRFQDDGSSAITGFSIIPQKTYLSLLVCEHQRKFYMDLFKTVIGLYYLMLRSSSITLDALQDYRIKEHETPNSYLLFGYHMGIVVHFGRTTCTERELFIIFGNTFHLTTSQANLLLYRVYQRAVIAVPLQNRSNGPHPCKIMATNKSRGPRPPNDFKWANSLENN